MSEEQPKEGMLWLCKKCGDGLVARGVFGSGLCRECYEEKQPQDEQARS